MSSQAGFGKRGVVSSRALRSFGRNQMAVAGASASAGAGVTRNLDYALSQTHSDEAITKAEMTLFVGPNWHKFEPSFEGWSDGKAQFSWCWPAFFIPTVWLLYRKMYMEFGLLLLAAVVLEFISGNLGTALGVFMAVQGKPIYFMHAKRKILALRNAYSSPEEVAHQISAAGGTSKAGAFIGSVIFVVSLVIVVATAVGQ